MNIKGDTIDHINFIINSMLPFIYIRHTIFDTVIFSNQIVNAIRKTNIHLYVKQLNQFQNKHIGIKVIKCFKSCKIKCLIIFHLLIYYGRKYSK